MHCLLVFLHTGFIRGHRFKGLHVGHSNRRLSSWKSGGWRRGHREERHRAVGGGNLAASQDVRDSWGQGRDHGLVHPTMFVSFLTGKGGSSVSVAGDAATRGRKPLLSIKLERRNQKEHVRMHFNMDCTWCHRWHWEMCVWYKASSPLTSEASAHITSHSSWSWYCCNCTGSPTPLYTFYLTKSPLSAQWMNKESQNQLLNEVYCSNQGMGHEHLHLHLLWGWRLPSRYGSLRGPEWTRWRRNKSPTPPQCDHKSQGKIMSPFPMVIWDKQLFIKINHNALCACR